MGNHQGAADLINRRISLPETDSHVGSLLAYSRFALQYDKVGEGLKGLLKSIVLDQHNKKTKEMLVKVLVTENGFKELISQIPPSVSSAAAYAFIGTIAKDYSAIDVTIKSYNTCLRFRPNSASYAINLIHAHEAIYDFRSAMKALVNFCKNNELLRVGSKGFSCLDLFNALPNDIKNSKPKDYVPTEPKLAMTWVEDDDRGYSRVHSILKTDTGGYSIGPEVDGLYDPRILNNHKEDYNDADLDLLAIGFTVIKLMFFEGRLADLPPLFRIIEPARRFSRASPHTTLIRNEHSYYQCIARVLDQRVYTSSLLENPKIAYSDPLYCPILLEAKQNPIYVVGDSHVMSPAWGIMTVNGKARLLIPRLVTGIKHWHLRKESNFYPKLNFEFALKNVPDGSDVIFIIGEIDCREGLLLATERDKYKNIGEGMDRTTSIFMDVLSSLVSKKKIKPYIHPVMPSNTNNINTNTNNINTNINNINTNTNTISIEGNSSARFAIQ